MKWYSASVIVLSLFFSGMAYAQDSVQAALDEGNVVQAQELLSGMTADSDAETAISGLCGQAQLAFASGDYMVAMAKLEEAAPKLSTLKKKNGWNVVVPWLKADVAYQQKDIITCKHELESARDALSSGAKVSHAWEGAVEYLASVCEEDNSHARDYAENAKAAFHKVKMSHEEGLSALRIAELEWARSKPRRAFREYDAAIQAFRTADAEIDRRLVAETLLTVAEHLGTEKYQSELMLKEQEETK